MAEWKTLMLDVARGKYVSLAEAEAKLAEAHKETEAANKTACDLEHSLRNGCLLVKGLKEKLAVADTKCDRCVFKGDGDSLVSRDNRIAALEAALREIEKGEGAFSMDHLTHADNTIDNMKSIAKRALEVPKEQQEN